MRCHEILELETELDQKVLNGLTVPTEIELLLESENVQYVWDLSAPEWHEETA